MNNSDTAREGAAQSSPQELVFALCHELGNLLAASRLEAALLDPAADRGDLVRAADRISEVAARAGSLLAQVRPLLAPASRETLRVDPLELLDGLRGGLDESCEDRVLIELKSAAQLSDVEIDPEMLHHLLLTAIFVGLEAAAPDGRVRVSAEVAGDLVAFVVEDEGRSQDPRPTWELRGRPLTQEIARTLLARQGGRLEVSASRDRTRVSFGVPLARR